MVGLRKGLRSAALGVVAAGVVGLPFVVEGRSGEPAWRSFGSHSGIGDAYLGSVYACGDVLLRATGHPRTVTILSVVTSGTANARVVAADRDSPAYSTGAAVFSKPELAKLNLRDVRGLKDHGDWQYRYLVLLTPREMGEQRVSGVIVRYRTGFITHEATVASRCEITVTHASGTDPRIGL